MNGKNENACNQLKVPVLLPVGRDAELVRRLLADENIDVVVCKAFSELLGLIKRESGPFVFGDEAVSERDLEELLKTLDELPKWSDPPAIVFLRKKNSLKKLRRISSRRLVSLMQRPVKKTNFALMLRAALEVRRRQYYIRDLLMDLRRTNEKLGSRTVLLQQLALELTRSEEKERKRIAEILHDDLQQILVSAKIQSELLTDSPDAGTAKAAGKLHATLSKAIDRSRALSRDLNPAYYSRSLGFALDTIANETAKNYGLQIRTEFGEEGESLDEGIQIFILRTVQELLMNCAKHANSDRVILTMGRLENFLTVTVIDDGVGFDPAKLKIRGGPEGGFGLFSIQERAEALGGFFDVESIPNDGSRFVLSVPVKIKASGDKLNFRVSHLLEKSIEADNENGKDDRESAIRVIIADDHTVIRQGLASMLQNHPDIRIEAEAADGEEAVALAVKLRPHVVLMDVSMPVIDGVEATRRIKNKAPDVAVIGLSMHASEEVRKKMLRSGAEGYVVKYSPARELLSAIKKISPREP